jgi:hypothetical protein
MPPQDPEFSTRSGATGYTSRHLTEPESFNRQHTFEVEGTLLMLVDVPSLSLLDDARHTV